MCYRQWPEPAQIGHRSRTSAMIPPRSSRVTECRCYDSKLIRIGMRVNAENTEIQRALNWFLGFLDPDEWRSRKDAIEEHLELVLAPRASREEASRHRMMVRGRIDKWCHGWGKKKAPPKWGFQPRCPLSCEFCFTPRSRRSRDLGRTSVYDPTETSADLSSRSWRTAGKLLEMVA